MDLGRLAKKMVAAVAVVAVVAGCSSTAATSTPAATAAPTQAPATSVASVAPTADNTPVHIKFISVQHLDEGWPANLKAITDKYAQTHPGSTFDIQYVADVTQLPQTVQLAESQGALPLLYNADNDLITQLKAKGEVADLEQFLTQQGVTSEVSPGAISTVKQQSGTLNELVALPFEINIEGFWYNKKMFSDAGLQPPATWDDLVADAAAFQAKGIQPFAASGKQGWPITRLIANYLFRKLGPDALAKVKAGTAKLTDPDYVAAAAAVADLGKKGYFGKGVGDLDYNPARDVFEQGKAAMFYMGSWELRSFNDPKLSTIGTSNIGYFPFPNVAGGVGTSDQIGMNAGQFTVVNAKLLADPANAAWLKFVIQNYGDEAMSLQGAVTGFVVHNPPASETALTKFVTDKIASTKSSVLWFEALFNTKATTTSQSDATPLVTGAMTPQAFMAAVQAANQ